MFTAGAATVSAQDLVVPFVIREIGQGSARLLDARRAIGGGNATILIPRDHYRQCDFRVDRLHR